MFRRTESAIREAQAQAFADLTLSLTKAVDQATGQPADEDMRQNRPKSP